MEIFMLGWEFPPYATGGLGTACYGLTKGLSKQKINITFVLPKKAKSKYDLKPAIEILEWVADKALPSGILSEQINPYTGEQLSVAPLTWSHAGFVIAVVKYLRKIEFLNKNP